MSAVWAAVSVVWLGSAAVLGVALARDWWRHRAWGRHLDNAPGLDEQGSRSRHPSAQSGPCAWECRNCGIGDEAPSRSDAIAAFAVHIRLAHVPAPRGEDA